MADRAIQRRANCGIRRARAPCSFQTQLALAELGRLAKLAIKPEGMLQANGTATIDAQNNYDVHAFLNTQG